MRHFHLTIRGWGALAALCVSLCLAAPAQPDLYGDLNTDGVANAPDVVRLVDHFDPSKPALPAELQPFADANRDAQLTEADLDWVIDAILRRVGLYGVNPIVRFAEPSTTVTEANTDLVLLVSLRGYNSTPGASVAYSVTGGTAADGIDFATTGTVAPILIDRAVIPLSIFDDAEREGTEYFEITIGPVAGFPNDLPSRHVVYIEDTERVWRGSLAAGTSTYTDVSSVDLVIANNAGAISGTLIGESVPSVPAGDWPADVTQTLSVFNASIPNLPVAVGDSFFGTAMTRTLTLNATFPGVQDDLIQGTFSDAYLAAGASHLNRTLQGTFDLYLVPDSTPEVEPEVLGP